MSQHIKIQPSKDGVRVCLAFEKMPEACAGTGFLSLRQRTFCSHICRSRYYQAHYRAKQKREREQRRLDGGELLEIKTVRPVRPAPTHIITPVGCILIKAKAGRCLRYYDCVHAGACLRLSLDLVGGGFTTENGCPGYQPDDEAAMAWAQHPDYVYGAPYPAHCLL
ncbi:hypothetical protein KAI46_08005 [bacterium]|nr:hypothetical protein [bacterium]